MNDLDSILLSVFVLNVIVFISLLILFFFVVKRSIIKKLSVSPDEGDESPVEGLVTFFRLANLSVLLSKHGHVAVLYAKFQRALIILLAILSFFALTCVLPTNATGENSAPSDVDCSGFYCPTTVENIILDKSRLWVPAIASLVFCLVGLAITAALVWYKGHISTSLDDTSPQSPSNLDTAVLTLRNLPLRIVSDANLMEFMSKSFDEDELISTFVALNVSEYIDALNKLSDVRHQLFRVRKTAERKGSSPSTFVFEDKRIRYVKAVPYWEDKQKVLNQRRMECEEDIKTRPVSTGIGFIVLRHAEVARSILSGEDDRLKEFSPSLAANPQDIAWENLGISRSERLKREVIVHVASVVILLFFSTPLAILHGLGAAFDWNSGTNALPTIVSAFLLTYLPSLILLLISIYLAPFIMWLTKQEKRELVSTTQHRAMLRTFCYMFASIVILPTIALTLMDAIDQYRETDDMGETLKQAFLPNSGLFFVCFMIQAAFIGSAVALFRIPNIVHGLYELATGEEDIEIRQSSFPFFSEFPVSICITSVSIVYSLFSPIILVFGLIYMYFKHCADSYNLMNMKGTMNGDYKSTSSVRRRRMDALGMFIITAFIVLEVYMTYFFSTHQLAAQSSFCFIVLIFTCVMVVLWKYGAFDSKTTTASKYLLESLPSDIRYTCPQVMKLLGQDNRGDDESLDL